MRIRPDEVGGLLPERPTATPSKNSGFSSALASASAQTAAHHDTATRPEVGSGTGAYQRLIVDRRDAPAEIPLAERWGEYGAGARPGGYGDPPDPADFGDVPLGSDQPAHPLNPSGTSGGRVPYDIPGYTARGTPIPPGFYNLAYYQRYLREGGTPLEGFPAWDPEEGTLAETYGTYGDGRTRATSFEATPPAGPPPEPEHPCSCSCSCCCRNVSVEETAGASRPVAVAEAQTTDAPPAAATTPESAAAPAPPRSRAREAAAAAARNAALPAEPVTLPPTAIATERTLAAARLDALARTTLAPDVTTLLSEQTRTA